MRLTALAAALAALAGCERIVSVDLPPGETLLVVEARLEAVRGRAGGVQRVRLTTTDAYFADRAPPPARGAVVRVTDDAGRAATFAESTAEPGVYETAALPVERGRRYALAVEYGGDRYVAVDTARAVPAIDSLYFAAPLDPFDTAGGLRATIDFRDPPGASNYYLWDLFVDGRRVALPEPDLRVRAVSDDAVFDGRRVLGLQPYEGVRVGPGQEVVVRQMALSTASYRYYSALSEQTGNDGSPFDVPASSVRGNVANATTPARRALGYFIAAEVSEARARVPGR